jgi:hypothetical protein
MPVEVRSAIWYIMSMRRENPIGELAHRAGQAVGHDWQTKTGQQDRQRQTGTVVMEDTALYKVRPANRMLE